MSTEVKQPPFQALADCNRQGSPGMLEGQVISITADELVMANKDGKLFTHALADDAQVTCDGTTCKAEDLKPGRKIHVTTEEGDRNVVTCIEALDKNADFAAC